MTGNKPLNWLWFWGPPLAWVVLMQLMTLRPSDTPPLLWFPGMDKLMHLAYFGGFAVMAVRALHGYKKMTLWRAAIAACLLTVAYGTADELKQNLQPHRMVELADWIANVAGATIALVVPLIRKDSPS